MNEFEYITENTRRKMTETLSKNVWLYMLAKSNYEQTKDTIAAIVAPVFARFSFRVDLGDCGRPKGAKIDNEDYLYMATDYDQLDRYYATRHAAIINAGYDVPQNVCPALLARNVMLAKRRELIEASEPFLGCEYGKMSTCDMTEFADLICAFILSTGAESETNHV